MSKRVVHLSSVHKAVDTRIFLKECGSLASEGYDVTLIARGDEDGEINGVKIRVVKSIAGNRLSRMTRTASSVYRRAREAGGDIYHFHDPELIPVGLILKLLGKPVIFDAHEDVSRQILDKDWIPAYLRRPVSSVYRFLERSTSRVFDGIVAATPSIGQNFPADKTVVVQNFPRLAELESQGKRPYEDRPLNVAYVGGLTEIRGVRQILEAMTLVNERMKVRMLFAGSITPSPLADEVTRADGWRYVENRGWQDRKGIADLLADTRLGLVLFLPAGNHIESQPNKLFEYMMAGLPVVASHFDYWRQFVDDVGSGIQVDPTQPAEIADAIVWILEHPEEARAMGERGREAVLERYTWEQEAEKLIALYNKLLAPEDLH